MIKPTGHRVLIKPDKVEKTTASGIILGIDEKLEKGGVQKGLLVDTGPQAWKAFSVDFSGPPWATAGDYIYFSRYAGKFVQDPADPDTEYMIMNDEDILGVITDEIPEYMTNEAQEKLNSKEGIEYV